MKNSSFIRDLLVKLLLIVIFIFLLMYLFPMPNLSPFYSSIFNNNIQTMKDAAEDYYTTERMPSKVGKSTKMTLQDMIDKKLIIPFVDKDGKECNTKKSYVKVTKLDNEYELKVSLTCGKETDYIIEKIGCYNFCPTGNCTLADAKAVKEETKPVTTKIADDGTVTVVVPTGYNVTEYEYKKVTNNETWTLGDWVNNKINESADVKLADTRTQYTGQKKVTTGTTLYEQIAYGYKDNWTYDEKWSTDTKKTSDTVKLWKERTLYTGQKKVENTVTEYQHVKYADKDSWTYDSDWTTEKKNETDILKLWKERTLYTGQKKVSTGTTEYQHVKYETKENWNETGYTVTKRNETNDVKLVSTRYTLTGKVNKTTNTCTNETVDSNWYTSVPANTSDRTYNSTAVNSKTEYGDWKVIYESYKSRTTYSTFEGDKWYEFLYSNDEVCTSACNGQSKVRYYYYRVHQGTPVTKYQYKYCVPGTTTTSVDDTKVVYSESEKNSYISKGYTLVKTEYNYKVRTYSKVIVDTKWTTSKTSPSGYEYTGKNQTSTSVKYEDLGKWVTSKEALGEYTENIKTVKQYKYAHKATERYIVDTKWTTSKTSPSGYEYTGKTSKSTTVKYEQLNKWVTSKEALGEYTYNITTVKQYKYAYNNKERYVRDTIWTTENVAKSGYELTGKTKTTSKTSYVDLGSWVNSKSSLGEYTYNIQTRTQYRYKYRKVTSSTEIKWATENPGNGFEPTGRSRTTYVSTGTKTVTTTNKQK